jgi:hypothetical protein
MAARQTHTEPSANLSVSDAARSSALEMSKYFGPLRNSDVETFASDAFAHETHNLPRAYVGRNKFLMATIDFLITKDDDWYTRHVLPWLYTEELHVKWNIWRFNRTMMDYEPEQGVPRYVSYESESRSDSLVRRGLAFIIEHGFYKTEIGRQHYLMNLKQIVEAVHETVYYGVIHELLASPNFYQQWQQKHGNRHSLMQNDATVTLAEERWRFACVQKDVKGLFVLDAEIKDRMRRVGIEPDAWVFPSKMAIYASMVPEYFNEYSRGGAPATTALEDGAKRFDSFRGNRVFETRSFDTDFMNAGATEPLTRHRQIGEYYLLGDHAADYAYGMQIFDMSKDAFSTITHDNALQHAHVGAEDAEDGSQTLMGAMGVVEMPKSLADHAADMIGITNWTTLGRNNDTANSAAATNWFKAVMHQVSKHADAIIALVDEYIAAAAGGAAPGNAFNGCSDVRHFTAAASTANVTGREGVKQLMGWKNLNEAAPGANSHLDEYLVKFYHILACKHRVILCPYKLLIFRPRMTYRMSTAILLKGGEELGQTLHGHHDFQLTDDVIHKTHIGHYTFYSKSVVRDPKLMYLAEDVYCSGYVGGENTQFVDPDGKSDEALNDVTVNTKALIAVPVPYNEKLGTCMSLTGNLKKQGINTTEADNGGYSTSDCIKTHFPHSDTNNSPETAFTEEEGGEIGMNGVCFRGAQKRYHKDTGDWKTHTVNTGHWGPNVYDGCGMVRMGMYAHLKVI